MFKVCRKFRHIWLAFKVVRRHLGCRPYRIPTSKGNWNLPPLLWMKLLSCMMTSSNGNISALLAICAGNSPVPGEFPTQRPVTRSFDVYFDLRPNKRLSKQSWGWWFETPSRPLWRHRNEVLYVIDIMILPGVIDDIIGVRNQIIIV